jgi:pilin isopeptide linkage protein
MMKKKMSKMLSGLLATAMVFSMSTIAPLTAQAATVTNTGNTKLEVEKDLSIINGVTLMKGDLNFKIKMVPDTSVAEGATETNTSSAGSSTWNVYPGVDLGTDATQTITFKSDDFQSDNKNLDLVSINKTTTFDFTHVEFAEVGAYRYLVSEDTTDAVSAITYDNRTYTVDVYVTANEDGGKEIAAFVAKLPGVNGKQDIIFENKWNTSDLTITKTVKGNAANKNAKFAFNLMIPAPGDLLRLPEGNTVKATIKEGNTVIDTVYIVVGDAGTDFTLKDGQSLSIDALPAGMIYTVTETSQNYTATVKATQVENKELVSKDQKVTVSGDKTSYSGTISELSGNKVDFTNTLEQSVATGLVLSIAPYVVVFLLAAVGAVVFFARKKNM